MSSKKPNPQMNILGGQFYGLSKGSSLTLKGRGGGTNIIMGGNARGNVVTDSLNDNSSHIGVGGDPHNARGSGSTDALSGQRARTVLQGRGPAAGSIVVIDDVLGANVQESGNDYSTTVGSTSISEHKGEVVPPGEGTVVDEGNSTGDEDLVIRGDGTIGGSLGDLMKRANEFSKAQGSLGGRRMGARAGVRAVPSSTRYSASGVVAQSSSGLAGLGRWNNYVNDPANHQKILQATGGPIFRDIAPGVHQTFVDNSETTIVIEHDNLDSSYHNNAGNDNSHSRD